MPAECSAFPWLEEVPIYKILIALALLVLLAYANSLHGEFVFDDTKQILNNPTLRGPVHLFQAFTTDVWAFQKSYSTDIPPPYYRPMFTLWLDLGYRLFKLWPPGWHLLSVLLHVIATGMMFLLILEVTGRKSLSTLAALLFAVHPIHSESVSWVSAVPDLQLAVLFLPALYFYYRARTTGRRRYWLGSLALFALSTLCKENALSLPLIVLGIEWFSWKGSEGAEGRSAERSRVRTTLLRASGYLLMGLLYLWARFEVLGLITWKHPFDKDLTNLVAYISVPRVLLAYIEHLVFPFNLSLFYNVEFVRSMASGAFLGPALIVGMLLTLWVFLWRKMGAREPRTADTFLLASLLFMAPLLPVLNLKAFHEEYLVQDRYLYLPSIGFCLLLAMGLLALKGAGGVVRIRTLVFPVVIALLLLGTIVQNRVWTDSVSLWTRARDHRPHSWHAHYNLGLALYLHQRYPQAEEELNIAARFAPNNPLVFNNLGLTEAQLFKNDQAVSDFERAIQLDPSMTEAYINLGDLQYRLQHVTAAEINFQKALQLEPRSTIALYNLARLHTDRGVFSIALQEWQQLLGVDAADAEARYQVGLTLKKMNRLDEARAQWRQALNDAPHDVLRRKILEEIGKGEK